MARGLFVAADTDNSGTLNAKELEGVRAIPLPLTPGHVTAVHFIELYFERYNVVFRYNAYHNADTRS